MSKRNVVPIAVVVLGLAAACGSIPDRNPLPAEHADSAIIPGIPNARFWGDENPELLRHVFALDPEELRRLFGPAMGREHNYLAISGGGPDGAFGAGLLVGWTAVGTRPQFQLVTGISTGALTAPFAFLGSEYDRQLEEVYTTYRTKDMVKERSLLSVLGSSSFVSSEPLQRMIEKYVDQEMLDRIGEEFVNGRNLLIGTTNLDASRPVIWNIGWIAHSKAPGALELFRKVLLASASIPGAFPPVLIEVEADGKRYDEIHVDGGTTTQVFIYPSNVDWTAVKKLLEIRGEPTVYVIRNGHLKVSYEQVKPTLRKIAGRSISALIRTQGVGDLFRMYLQSQKDGLQFRLASIPDDFDVEPNEMFDPVYMKALFDRGYEMAKAGYPWLQEPPGLVED